ncbi:hypothetical protein PVAND_009582 [Polypedilum vanderplanki]|uniref:Uncharacterized protein n=1 Tax=Polypedilum vanderplanki TaxID=319348 RepID=A0A9J6CE56_POLVA|nr:hypothetical protein PVAND_009582 [Polypedilum vanderplanki]
MLTDDIYQKPNPFYTKKPNNNVKTDLKVHLYPVYKPKHNESYDSVQDTSASQSINNYEQPPTAYDEKTHTYNTYLPPSSYGYGPAAPMPSQSSSSEYSNTQVHSTYGPPSYSYYPHSSYGPPTAAPYPYYPTAPQQPYEIDQKSHEGFFLKLIKKFDLVLMSKILLKLIIFKKIEIPFYVDTKQMYQQQ